MSEELAFEVSKKTVYKVKIYEQVYEIRKPVVKDASVLSSFKEESSDEKKLEKTMDLLASLGLPKDVSQSMEIDHFTQLVQKLFGELKKN